MKDEDLKACGSCGRCKCAERILSCDVIHFQSGLAINLRIVVDGSEYVLKFDFSLLPNEVNESSVKIFNDDDLLLYDQGLCISLNRGGVTPGELVDFARTYIRSTEDWLKQRPPLPEGFQYVGGTDG